MSPKNRRLAGLVTAFVVAGAVIVWSFAGVEFSMQRFLEGTGRAKQYLSEMWPPDLTILPRAIRELVITVQMAVAGTVIGVVLAVPVSFVAARTGVVPRWISSVIKMIINAMRGVHPYIYAILFIYMVGLGPFPGALGIGVGSFVMLSKLYAEALESVHPAPVEAVRAVGGSPIQVFSYGMLPQALPQFLSHTLYAWELAISAATILGVVGAGGIGALLVQEILYFKWKSVFTLVLVLVPIVMLADTLSYQVRKRVT